MAANLPNGNFIRWLIDNLPALGAAIAAAGGVLMTFRRRTFWVWVYAVSTFFVTLFTYAGKEKVHSDQDAGQE